MYKMISRSDAEQLFGSAEQAMKDNKILQIDENHYLLIDYEENGVTWHVDSVRRLSDKEMKDHKFICRYRFKAHVTKAPEGYCGNTSVHAGIFL